MSENTKMHIFSFLIKKINFFNTNFINIILFNINFIVTIQIYFYLDPITPIR